MRNVYTEADYLADKARREARGYTCDWIGCDAHANFICSSVTLPLGDFYYQLCFEHQAEAEYRYVPKRRGWFVDWRDRHFGRLSPVVPRECLKSSAKVPA